MTESSCINTINLGHNITGNYLGGSLQCDFITIYKGKNLSVYLLLPPTIILTRSLYKI
jgi:hypothetical protein